MSLSVLHMFSSKSFIVSGLTFRSLIYFQFIFGYVLGSILIHSFICSCPFFPALFIEKAFFVPLYILASFVRNKVPINTWVYFCAFYLAPLVYISVFAPVPYCLDVCSLQHNLKSGRLTPPASFFFLRTALAIPDLLCFYMSCEIFCSSSVKNAFGNLIGVALNLQIAFGNMLFSQY